MKRLVQIEWIKTKKYKTFWVLASIYFLFLIGITSSGMEALKWLASHGANFGDYDINKIPLYHFPDIWQNLTWVAQKFKLLLGIYLIISVTNEFSYKTIRQNVIDGLSRTDFIASKTLFALFISLISTLVVFILGMILGSTYSPTSEMEYMFKHVEFIPAFFLATFNFLLLSMLIGYLFKRAGLAIVILLVYPALEWMIKIPLPTNLEFLTEYLPYSALTSLIDFPFPRYVLMEIRDSVGLQYWVINMAYIPVLIYASYVTIARKNLS